MHINHNRDRSCVEAVVMKKRLIVNKKATGQCTRGFYKLAHHCLTQLQIITETSPISPKYLWGQEGFAIENAVATLAVAQNTLVTNRKPTNIYLSFGYRQYVTLFTPSNENMHILYSATAHDNIFSHVKNVTV